MLNFFKKHNELHNIIANCLNNKCENNKKLILSSMEYILYNELFVEDKTDLNEVYRMITEQGINNTIIKAFIHSIAYTVLISSRYKLTCYQNEPTYNNDSEYDNFNLDLENEGGIYQKFPFKFFEILFTDSLEFHNMELLFDICRVDASELNDINKIITQWTISKEKFSSLLEFFENHEYLKLAVVLILIRKTDYIYTSLNRIALYHEGYFNIIYIKLVKQWKYKNVLIYSSMIKNKISIDNNYVKLLKERFDDNFENIHTDDRPELNNMLDELQINNKVSFNNLSSVSYKDFGILFNYLVLADRKQDMRLLLIFNDYMDYIKYRSRYKLLITNEIFKYILFLNNHSRDENKLLLSPDRSVNQAITRWYNNMV